MLYINEKVSIFLLIVILTLTALISGFERPKVEPSGGSFGVAPRVCCHPTAGWSVLKVCHFENGLYCNFLPSRAWQSYPSNSLIQYSVYAWPRTYVACRKWTKVHDLWRTWTLSCARRNSERRAWCKGYGTHWFAQACVLLEKNSTMHTIYDTPMIPHTHCYSKKEHHAYDVGFEPISISATHLLFPTTIHKYLVEGEYFRLFG